MACLSSVLSKNFWQFVAKALLPAACVLAAPAAEACASCGCTLSSEWTSQGISGNAGVRLDLRYDFLDQSQLRTGTGLASRADHPLPADREVERRTINRYATAGLDYTPNRDWGINFQIPYLVRSHTTVAEGDTGLSSSHSSSIGDIRILGRYQGFPVGIQLGLKLPTGGHERKFNRGPQLGEPLDRGLQPGSGSADLLLGVYKAEALGQDFDYFVQALIQTPVSTQDHFRPGSSLNFNLGLSYVALGSITPQLQVNARTVGRDHGVEADTRNSGGTLVDLSPGVTVAVSKQTRLYGLVQLPIYQRVGGLQLAPRWTASLGLSLAF